MLSIASSLLIIGYISITSFGNDTLKAKHYYKEHMKTKLTLYEWTQAPVNNAQLRANFLWNNLQSRYQCCGLSGPLDWNETGPLDMGKQVYPRSCCPTPDDSQLEPRYCSDDAALYKLGCIEKIDLYRRILKAYYLFVAFLLLSLAFITTNLTNYGVESIDPMMIQLSWRRTLGTKTVA